jgi:hypothetical protein
MSDNLESELRHALRPVAPDDEFTRKLLDRLAAERGQRPQTRFFGTRWPKYSAWWIPASLAASALIAVGISHHLQAQRERALGMQARRQVIEALHVTTQKLDLAYQVVRTQSSALSDEDPGV